MVEVKLCIDVDIYDVALIIQAARAAKIPIDALLKKAIADAVDKVLAPPTQTSSGGGS